MLTKACAIELAPHDIQVNAIAPGAIEVERYHDIPGYDRDDVGAAHPRRARRAPRRHRPAGGLPLLRRAQLHHRPDHLGRRRTDQPAVHAAPTPGPGAPGAVGRPGRAPWTA